MTIPRLIALNRAWKQNPPAHVAIAAYIGWGRGSSQDTKNVAEDDAAFQSFMQSVPQPGAFNGRN